jgi:hypothetical protein
VSNAIIRIERIYDTGTEDANAVGETYTNEDGVFDLMANVKQSGNLKYYAFFLMGSVKNFV